VVDPNLEAVVGLGEYPIRTVPPEKADELIERMISFGVSFKLVDYMRKDLQAKLGANSTLSSNVEFWRECAEHALPMENYASRLAGLLSELVCSSMGIGPPIIESIRLHRFANTSGFAAKYFARDILGLNGRPCRGAENISPTTRHGLEMSLEPRNG
jgi:hypothetical protein